MFSLSDTVIDPGALKRGLANPASGACVTFEGWVRNHNDGRSVDHLCYESFAPLALSEGARILSEARRRFGVHEAVCVHRTGTLAIGECAVWVGVSTAHRGEAFDACRYIIDEVKHRVPIWKREIYTDGAGAWVRCEHCAAHSHDHATDETGMERHYYARHAVLPEIGAAGQARLAQARVLVVGAGALGCGSLPYLAGAGIGLIGICDDDTISLSNLHRQTLYDFTAEGKPKAQAAAEYLRARNPFIEVRALPFRLSEENAAEVLEDFDVIVDGTDSLTSHFLLNDAAVAHGKLLIHAALYQYEGQVFVWNPADDGPDLRALWATMPDPATTRDCATAGVLGPVAGTLGTLEATETLKQILDLPGRLRGEMIVLDLLSFTSRRLKLPNANPAERTTKAQRPLERDAKDCAPTERLVLVDIREENATRENPFVAAARVLPMDLVTDYVRELADVRADIVLCCARGLHSRALAQRLRRAGLENVYALRGGLNAWNQCHEAGVKP